MYRERRMPPELFNEEEIGRRFRNCSSWEEASNLIHDAINFVEDYVVKLWNSSSRSRKTIEEGKKTVTFNGTDYLFYWYGDSGCIDFKEGCFEFSCRLGKGYMPLESFLARIDEKLAVLRSIMPAYLNVKGKAERLDGIQMAGIRAEMKTMMGRYGITGYLEIRKQWKPGLEGWWIRLSGYKSDRYRHVEFDICKNNNPLPHVRLLEPIFRFFSQDYCIDINYQRPADNGYSMAIDSASDSAFPYFNAAMRINYAMLVVMYPICDISSKKVLVKMFDRAGNLCLDRDEIFFELDLGKHSVEDFGKGFKRLNEEFLEPLEVLRNLEGTYNAPCSNHTMFSIYVDFDKVLAAESK